MSSVASVTTSDLAKPTTPKEVMTKLLTGLYTLYYRQGNNPHPMQKTFFTQGANLRETVDEAKKHCEVMGIRFIRVTPFLNNLRVEEKQRMGGEELGE